METNSRVRPFLSPAVLDDDNTYAPPALSTYAIALLNENNTRFSQPISGLSDAEIKEDSHLRDSLKRKFSVHFKDLSLDSINSRIPPLQKSSESPHTNDVLLPTVKFNSFVNSAGHSETGGSGHNSNISITNSTGIFHHNSSSSDPNSNLISNIDLSTHTVLQNLSTSLTTPLSDPESAEASKHSQNSLKSSVPGGLSINLSSTSFPFKRSRLSRRFKSLGPPKRASEVESTLDEDVKRNYYSSDPYLVKSPSLPKSSFSKSPNLNHSNQAPNEQPEIKILPSPRALTPQDIDIQGPPVSKYFTSDSFLGSIFNRATETIDPRTKAVQSKQINPFERTTSSEKLDNRLREKTEIPTTANCSFSVFVDKSRFSETSKLHLSLHSSIGPRQPLNDILKESFNHEKFNHQFKTPKAFRPRYAEIAPMKAPLNPLVKSNPASFPVPSRRNTVVSRSSIPSDGKLPSAAQFPNVSSKHPPQIPLTAAPIASLNPPKSHEEIPVEDGSRRKTIKINSKSYEKLELLGRGGSSKVYKVRCLSSRQVFAIKKVPFDQFDESCVRGFKGEIDLLKTLKDEPRVVSLIDHAIIDNSIYLVMECGELDLAHLLQNKSLSNPKLDLNFVKFHATELLRCVQGVHKADIVHSDLKPANFLFVRGILKIIDFGIANAVPDHTSNIYRESQIGTPNYMAPEALMEVDSTLSASAKVSSSTWKVGKPSDIWSCGCIIYQMIYGRPPYGSFSGQQRIMAIVSPLVKIEYPRCGLGGVPVPESCVTLIKKCLERNPEDRWDVEECLVSDFLKPKAVSRVFVRDLIYSAVNFGMQQKDEGEISAEVYEKLINTVMAQIEELNFA